MSDQALDQIIAALGELYCGDSMCRFTTKQHGQRTNGGCRCLAGVPPRLERALHHAYWIHIKSKKDHALSEAAGGGE